MKSKRLDMLDEIKRALDIAEIIPFRYLIQHIGVSEEEFDERKVDAAFTCAGGDQSVCPRSAAWKCCWKTCPTRLSSAERLVQFLEQTHLKLNFCLDVGHANMNEGVATAFSHDEGPHPFHASARQRRQGRQPPVSLLVSEGGTIDWSETMRLLRSHPDAVSHCCWNCANIPSFRSRNRWIW